MMGCDGFVTYEGLFEWTKALHINNYKYKFYEVNILMSIHKWLLYMEITKILNPINFEWIHKFDLLHISPTNHSSPELFHG